jgi:hypothetical protein
MKRLALTVLLARRAVPYNACVKRFVLPLLLVVFGIPLAGCAGSGSEHPVSGAASKPQVRELSNQRSDARSPLVVSVGPNVPLEHKRLPRFLSPTRLAIATIGSTGCRTVPKRLVVQNPHAIKIRLEVKTPPNGACFDNAFFTRYVVAINPSQIDLHQRLTIRLSYPKGTIRKYRKPVVTTAPPL